MNTKLFVVSQIPNIGMILLCLQIKYDNDILQAICYEMKLSKEHLNQTAD